MNYIVKVKITPSDPKSPNSQYKASFFMGEYVSKGKRTKREKIEEQVKGFLLKNLTSQNPDMSFDVKVVNIESFNRKFVVAEDKE